MPSHSISDGAVVLISGPLQIAAALSASFVVTVWKSTQPHPLAPVCRHLVLPTNNLAMNHDTFYELLAYS